MTLTAKQERFALEYTVDLCATQAAIRAGYSKRSAAEIGYETLMRPQVSARIAQLVEERNERVQVDSDWVLRRLVELADVDLAGLVNEDGSVKKLSEMPQSLRRLLAGIEVTTIRAGGKRVGTATKVKLTDRLRILELIGKHVEVNAFREQLQVTRDQDLIDRIMAGRKRAQGHGHLPNSDDPTLNEQSH